MCQFGFKESTSTCDELLDFTGYLQTNNDKHCAAVSIDIKKTFDSLDHYILLAKLYLYGFRGLNGGFIKSYLTNINQYIHFNSFISSTLPIYMMFHGVRCWDLSYFYYLLNIYKIYKILVILHFLQMIQLLHSLIKIYQTLTILLMKL